MRRHSNPPGTRSAIVRGAPGKVVGRNGAPRTKPVEGWGATDGVLSRIGNTPLARLTRLLADSDLRLFAKLEGLNPAGSMKDRAALGILRGAIDDGRVTRATTIVESSSGNMGIGLAQACAYFGLRFICVVDPTVTERNVALLRAYGAEVDRVTEPDAVSRQYLPARIERVRRLLGSIENSFWPNQYANAENARAHYRTMHEIVSELRGRVDMVLCPTSTCGTIRGCGEYVRGHGLATRVYAVDAVGSVIFDGEPGKRLIPGLGSAMKAPLLRKDLVHGCVRVSDADCVAGCRKLLRLEAILAGGSSGGVVAAIESLAPTIPAGSTCVLILPDRGDRYLDTIYSDSWVAANLGDVSRSRRASGGVIESHA